MTLMEMLEKETKALRQQLADAQQDIVDMQNELNDLRPLQQQLADAQRQVTGLMGTIATLREDAAQRIAEAQHAHGQSKAMCSRYVTMIKEALLDGNVNCLAKFMENVTGEDNETWFKEWLGEQVEPLRQRIATLEAALADPPPDIQEAVIRKLNLVSADERDRLQAQLEEGCLVIRGLLDEIALCVGAKTKEPLMIAVSNAGIFLSRTEKKED